MFSDGPIENFFKPPTEPPSDQGDGILYHLRRDLEKLYGKEGVYEGDASTHTMLATMGILAGIDYLSKVYSVYSSKNESRKRFVETIKDLCTCSKDDSEAIYQLRCALVHTVSLSTVSGSHRKGDKFIFQVIDWADTPLISKLSDNGNEVEYRINFRELKKCFKTVIDELSNICRDSSNPKNGHVINMVGEMHSEKIVKK